MGESFRGSFCLFVAAVGVLTASCSSSVVGTPQAVAGASAATSTVGSAPTTKTPTTVAPAGVPGSQPIDCGSLASALAAQVSGWTQSVLADGMCMWKGPDGARLIASAERRNYPDSALEDMRKSSGYTMQDPRLTELGAVAKGGPIISGLSPNVMVTLMLSDTTNDDKLALDLVIAIMRYADK